VAVDPRPRGDKHKASAVSRAAGDTRHRGLPMLANAELAQDFTILGQQYKKLISALLEVVNVPAIPVEVAPTSSGNFRGFDGNRFYVVERGSLAARYQGRTVYVLEEGEILLRNPAA